ncbi:MAG: hypothetical protein IJ506_04115 [Clostridia bacterium]|nr:hypothetical protein [Clostridia bacterium]
MEKDTVVERESEFLNLLLETEDLAEKKAKIYSKLLTEQSLAEDMKNLSERHTERKERLERILYGKKCSNKKRENDSEDGNED